MAKRLFADNDRYTEEARQLSQDIGPTIYSIVRKWVAKGYSARDIQLVIQMEALDACLMEIMDPTNYSKGECGHE